MNAFIIYTLFSLCVESLSIDTIILYFFARYWGNSRDYDYGTIRTTRYYTWRNNLFLECVLAGNFAVNNSTYITM